MSGTLIIWLTFCIRYRVTESHPCRIQLRWGVRPEGGDDERTSPDLLRQSVLGLIIAGNVILSAGLTLVFYLLACLLNVSLDRGALAG